MECLPWNETLSVFEQERAAIRRQRPSAMVPDKESERDRRCAWYAAHIDRAHASEVVQPVGEPGLVLAFRNNLLHKGGFPEPGESRMVFVFHLYPGETAFDFKDYVNGGMGKTDSYPRDPAQW